MVSSNDENSYDLDGIGRVPHIWAKQAEKTSITASIISHWLPFAHCSPHNKPEVKSMHSSTQNITDNDSINSYTQGTTALWLHVFNRSRPISVTGHNMPTADLLLHHLMSQLVFQSSTLLISHAS